MPENEWLKHYSAHFNCVELNVTFYRLVPRETFESWRRNTPKNFYFVAKGSRFITHIKKLNDIEEAVDSFLESSAGLKEKLLAMLWQLPPNFKKNPKRLSRLLELLRKSGKRQVFEFRNESWFCKEVYELLSSHNACLCTAYSKLWPCLREATSDFVYLRFHGSDALYSSNYSQAQLSREADFFRTHHKENDIFAFFNNDAQGYALKNAACFKELMAAIHK